MLSNSLCLSAGSLEDYLKSIVSFPVLTEEEERSLALAYTKDNCAKSKERFIQSFLRLVPGQVSSFSKSAIPIEDLIAEGNVGLIKAVEKFNPSKGVRFSAFARKYIKATIIDYFINQGNIVRMATSKPHRKIFFAIHAFKPEGKHISQNEREQFAKDHDVKVSDVYEMECKCLSGGDMPFDIQDDETDRPMSMEFHKDPGSDFAMHFLDNSEKKFCSSMLAAAINTLEDRPADIIRQRWLNEKATPLRELANKYTISCERVRQIEKDAIIQLKAYFMRHFDDVMPLAA